MNLPRTYITGFGEYLPGEPISSVTLAEAAGFRSVGDWIDQYVGAKTRYLAFNIATHEPTETLADSVSRFAQKPVRSLAYAGLVSHLSSAAVAVEFTAGFPGCVGRNFGR